MNYPFHVSYFKLLYLSIVCKAEHDSERYWNGFVLTGSRRASWCPCVRPLWAPAWTRCRSCWWWRGAPGRCWAAAGRTRCRCVLRRWTEPSASSAPPTGSYPERCSAGPAENHRRLDLTHRYRGTGERGPDSNLRCIVQPGVHRVAGRAQIRLSELVLLRPAERSVAQALLDDGVEPGQEEVQTSSFVRSLREERQMNKPAISTTDTSFIHFWSINTIKPMKASDLPVFLYGAET